MSTLKATNLQSPSAVNPAIVLAADGSATAQISSINNGPLAGFRNAIINGNFDIWQRGTSFTGSEYSADRWISGRLGTTHTVTQQAFTVGQTAVPNEPQWFYRTVVTSVAGAGNYALLGQRIENVRTFAGQQVTVSFWAKADATKNISVEMSQFFGTGGSPSATVNGINATKVSIGTSWQKVTVTTNVPSISGKTLGTIADSYLDLAIWFDAGSNFDARTNTLGQQSGTFEIAQVQVEPGPVATPFEQRPIGTELTLCQRYFYAPNETPSWRADAVYSGSALFAHFYYPTTMRATPTISGGWISGFNATAGPINVTRNLIQAQLFANSFNSYSATLNVVSLYAEL